jgi:hypothetical protein
VVESEVIVEVDECFALIVIHSASSCPFHTSSPLGDGPIGNLGYWRCKNRFEAAFCCLVLGGEVM